MQQPISSTTPQTRKRGGKFGEQLREGYDYRVIELVIGLVIQGYRSMCEENCYPDVDEEERFSAILTDHIEQYCPVYSSSTRQQWDVRREHPLDDERVRRGQANPRKVPRIDIIIVRWAARGKSKNIYPFECKRLDESDATLIRLYVQEGLQDRYLTKGKNYADQQLWGGMIGYVLRGSHETIVTKLNEQIKVHLGERSQSLQRHSPIGDFGSIYISEHQHPAGIGLLSITHLFFPVQFRQKKTRKPKVKKSATPQ